MPKVTGRIQVGGNQMFWEAAGVGVGEGVMNPGIWDVCR